MRATRRRPRTLDPLASPDAVRALCDQLRERLTELIPKSEKELLHFLYAVRHIERRPATDTRRGRPGHWRREDLLKASSELRTILQRETSGRVSLSSFVGQYLQMLHFPSDVTDALASGEINLQEAASLARLTGERLKFARRRRLALAVVNFSNHIWRCKAPRLACAGGLKRCSGRHKSQRFPLKVWH